MRTLALPRVPAATPLTGRSDPLSGQLLLARAGSHPTGVRPVPSQPGPLHARRAHHAMA